MNVLPINQVDRTQAIDNKQSSDALRQAATQFEAILLTQLTSALSKTDADDEAGEEKLFGGDSGTGLAKQMFSEQLAKTMAQSGGVGLAELILSKFGISSTQPGEGRARGLSNASNTLKSLRGNTQAMSTESSPVDRFEKLDAPAEKAIAGGMAMVEIVSTFEDRLRTEGIDPSLENLMLDGKIVNTTRPRIAPDEPISEMRDVRPLSTIAGATATSAPVEYAYPVAGRLSSGFGNRVHPIDKQIKFHGGLDLAVPIGTSVMASAGGVVKFAGWKGGYGNLVIIEHPDGRETRYGHLSKLNVVKDDIVSAGQQIALSGSTGKSTGPHVHFEVRESGQVVNPAKFLSNVLLKRAER